MLDFFSARNQVLAGAARLGSEEVPLVAAAGRVLAESIVAPAPLPPFDYSAMDGYALAAGVQAGDGPWELVVAGECRAGDAPMTLPVGQCLRIFTGAPIPQGADAVVIQENVERAGAHIRFAQRVRASENVRYAGEDLRAGSVALAAGTRLGAFHLGLAASLERERLAVARRPRVKIIPTGAELRAPGSPARPGSIPESNGVAISALASSAGAQTELCARVGDDELAASQAFSDALADADVLVTIGGVSVGDHDLVRPALSRAGVNLEFWKVALRPGKPFTLGRRDGRWVLGLPGNPVSAQLTFSLFGVPLLRALQGDARPLPAPLRVRLASTLRQKPGRLGCYRVRLEQGLAHPLENQASGSSVSLAMADALVFMPADASECAAGSELDALRLAEL